MTEEELTRSDDSKGVAEVADNLLRARFWASVVDRRAGQILVVRRSPLPLAKRD